MNLFSPGWWISTLATTCVTMFFIWLIKKGTSKVDIPLVSQIAQEV